jgi:Zn-finger nucleic acid-binding protein
MKCLVCENVKLEKKTLCDELDGFVCDKCSGVWIQAKAYWRWLKSHGSILPEKPLSEGIDLDVEDSKGIKICVDCGHFLTKAKVGHGVLFHIDRCETCGGVWLDGNEWDVLKSRNLHDEIHLVFSPYWQREIREKMREAEYESWVKGKLGIEVYLRAKEFKEWLQAQADINVIRAYLNH